MNLFGLDYEIGWIGAFTRHQADGAILNGTTVLKTNSEPDDGHPDGTVGTVLGSIPLPDEVGKGYLYFVEWAVRPRTAVGIADFKLARAVP